MSADVADCVDYTHLFVVVFFKKPKKKLFFFLRPLVLCVFVCVLGGLWQRETRNPIYLQRLQRRSIFTTIRAVYTTWLALRKANHLHQTKLPRTITMTIMTATANSTNNTSI